MLSTKLCIFGSGVGAFLGLSAFICFAIVYGNLEAGVWALFSGIEAALTLLLHLHFLMESLFINFSPMYLKSIGDVGVFGLVSGMGLTTFYIFLEFYKKAGVLPIETSIIIKLVWAFMMFKWGLFLYRTSQYYLHADHSVPLVSDAFTEEDANNEPSDTNEGKTL